VVLASSGNLVKKKGVVKFKDVRNEEQLGVRLQDVWFWNTKLKVNRARFGREKQQLVEEKKSKEGILTAGPSTVVGRSFKQALSKNGAEDRKQETPTLEIRPSEELLEWLQGSYVGELYQDLDSKEVQQMLVMEGLAVVKVTGMGDKMVLLQIDGNREIEEVTRNHKEWWESMFSKISKWSPNKVAVRRSVWLKVMGIPLHVWEEPTFKALGSLFGVFLDFDEVTISKKRLDWARIKVSTGRKFFIDEQVNISVMGAVYGLWVVEEGGRGWSWPEQRWRDEEEGRSEGSTDGDVAREERRAFSEEEVNSPRSLCMLQKGSPIVVPSGGSKSGSGVQMLLQKDLVVGPNMNVSLKTDVEELDPLVIKQVSSLGVDGDMRGAAGC